MGVKERSGKVILSYSELGNGDDEEMGEFRDYVAERFLVRSESRK